MSDETQTTTVNAQLQDTTSAGKGQYASPDVGTQTICTADEEDFEAAKNSVEEAVENEAEELFA